MTTWIVSRHPGAVEWLRRQGIEADKRVAHLEASMVAAGDRVIGTLPVNIIAELCSRGASYFHLDLRLLPEQRGRELSADDMDAAGAQLIQYAAEQIVADQTAGAERL